MVEVALPGRPSVTYTGLAVSEMDKLVRAHCRPRGLVRRLSQLWTQGMDSLLLDEGGAALTPQPPITRRESSGEDVFFNRQVHIAMEHYGCLQPLDLDEYLAHDGFVAARARRAARADSRSDPSPRPRARA